MHLSIITSQGIELGFTIDDWAPINKKKKLTEIGLACIDIKQAKEIHLILAFNSINVSVGTDYLLILDKPNEFKYDPKKDKLTLKYK